MLIVLVNSLVSGYVGLRERKNLPAAVCCCCGVGGVLFKWTETSCGGVAGGCVGIDGDCVRRDFGCGILGG